MSQKKYDLLMLLVGEDLTKMPRTAFALDLYRSGLVGNILVSGSIGGFTDSYPAPDFGPHVRTANLLNINGVPSEKIFTDYRPVDTLGNFVFPYHLPLPGNPNPNELETVFLTEEGHINRAIECAQRVIPQEKIVHVSSKGEYDPQGLFGFVIKKWHEALINATRDIHGNPQAAYDFLMTQHPFYRKDWFDLPIQKRKLEIIKFILAKHNIDL